MYRRSDNPERNAPTRQMPAVKRSAEHVEHRNSSPRRNGQVNADTNVFNTVRPAPTHGKRPANIKGNNSGSRPGMDRTAEYRRQQASHTASIPTQRRTATGSAGMRNAGDRRPVDMTRTGAAPYIQNRADGRGRPAPRRRKEPLYILILRWLYVRRREVAVCLGVFLLACIAIPFAVYAASVGDSSTPDFEILSTEPSSDDIISADLAGGAFDPTIPDDKGTSTDDEFVGPIIEENEDDTAEDEEEKDEEEEESSTEPEEETSDSTDTSDPSEDEPQDIERDEDAGKFYVTIGFYDRESITCLTGPATLREILYNAGYSLRDSDRPTVSLDEKISSESWIMIDSVTYETVTEKEAIPFDVETVEVQTVPRGTTRTVTAGVYGSKDKVYTVQYVNGVEVERNFEYEYVSSYPTNQVNYYGTGGTVYASDGSSYSYSYYITVKATYYSIHGNTATGVPTGNSVMAVDPSVIPLGSYVYVKNDYYDMGVKLAADTGGAVKGNIIDIWMDENHPHYNEFSYQGVCSMVAYILD